MSNKDCLGDRMKRYELTSKSYLMRRSNVIIRIDGCHFHSFTKGLRKPYDPLFIEVMQLTTKDLCEHIQGCKIGYVENRLVLMDLGSANGVLIRRGLFKKIAVGRGEQTVIEHGDVLKIGQYKIKIQIVYGVDAIN